MIHSRDKSRVNGRILGKGCSVDRHPRGVNPSATFSFLLASFPRSRAKAARLTRWAQEPKTNHLQNCAEKVPETPSLTR